MVHFGSEWLIILLQHKEAQKFLTSSQYTYYSHYTNYYLKFTRCSVVIHSDSKPYINVLSCQPGADPEGVRWVRTNPPFADPLIRLTGSFVCRFQQCSLATIHQRAVINLFNFSKGGARRLNRGCLHAC